MNWKSLFTTVARAGIEIAPLPVPALRPLLHKTVDAISTGPKNDSLKILRKYEGYSREVYICPISRTPHIGFGHKIPASVQPLSLIHISEPTRPY